MALIQPNMAVKCRTPEEVQLFEEIARAEGHKFASGDYIDLSGKSKRAYVVNYRNSHRFPDDIAYSDEVNYVDDRPGNCTTIVEASRLFRNILILRRAKNGHH